MHNWLIKWPPKLLIEFSFTPIHCVMVNVLIFYVTLLMSQRLRFRGTDNVSGNLRQQRDRAVNRWALMSPRRYPKTYNQGLGYSRLYMIWNSIHPSSSLLHENTLIIWRCKIWISYSFSTWSILKQSYTTLYNPPCLCFSENTMIHFYDRAADIFNFLRTAEMFFRPSCPWKCIYYNLS